MLHLNHQNGLASVTLLVRMLGARKKRRDKPDTKDASRADQTELKATEGKRLRGMLSERRQRERERARERGRDGGVTNGNQYNWSLHQDAPKIKNPAKGKFLASLDSVWIIVGPFKQVQDPGGYLYQPDEKMIVISAWRFLHTPNTSYLANH